MSKEYSYKDDIEKTADDELDKIWKKAGYEWIKSREECLKVVIHNLVAEVSNLRVANEALQDSVEWEKL